MKKIILLFMITSIMSFAWTEKVKRDEFGDQVSNILGIQEVSDRDLYRNLLIVTNQDIVKVELPWLSEDTNMDNKYWITKVSLKGSNGKKMRFKEEEILIEGHTFTFKNKETSQEIIKILKECESIQISYLLTGDRELYKFDLRGFNKYYKAMKTGMKTTSNDEGNNKFEEIRKENATTIIFINNMINALTNY